MDYCSEVEKGLGTSVKIIILALDPSIFLNLAARAVRLGSQIFLFVSKMPKKV